MIANGLTKRIVIHGVLKVIDRERYASLRLSARELAKAGRTRQEIGAELGLTYHSVVAMCSGMKVKKKQVSNGNAFVADDYEPHMAEEPTYTVPGSPERIAVYQARASRGESLFHPADKANEIFCKYEGAKIDVQSREPGIRYCVVPRFRPVSDY